MRHKKFFAFLTVLLLSLAELAALAFAYLGAAPASAVTKARPGDVIAVFNNPFPDVPVTAESLFRGSGTQEPGVHAAYIDTVARSLDAKVVRIYEALSVEGGNITALLHTDAKSEGTLWLELRMRPDVRAPR